MTTKVKLLSFHRHTSGPLWTFVPLSGVGFATPNWKFDSPPFQRKATAVPILFRWSHTLYCWILCSGVGFVEGILHLLPHQLANALLRFRSFLEWKRYIWSQVMTNMLGAWWLYHLHDQRRLEKMNCKWYRMDKWFGIVSIIQSKKKLPGWNCPLRRAAFTISLSNQVGPVVRWKNLPLHLWWSRASIQSWFRGSIRHSAGCIRMKLLVRNPSVTPL